MPQNLTGLAELHERRELDLALDEVGLVSAHGRGSRKQGIRRRIEVRHAGAIEQQQEVVRPRDLIAELHLVGDIEALLERDLAPEVGRSASSSRTIARSRRSVSFGDSNAMVRAMVPLPRSRRSRRAIADGESGTSLASDSAVRPALRCAALSSARSKRSSIMTSCQILALSAPNLHPLGARTWSVLPD